MLLRRAQRFNNRSHHRHHRQSIHGLCQHLQTGTSAPARGHAKAVVSLLVRHPHRRLCHDSGLRQPTIRQLLPLHTYMADNKLVTKVGRTPEPTSATSRITRTGSRLMLSSLIKNEFAHCPLTWPSGTSYRPAFMNPSPTSRRPYAQTSPICFWHRELQPVIWNCSTSCVFRSRTCGIAFASRSPPVVFLPLESRKDSLKTTCTAMFLCMALTFRPAPASSTSSSFDLTCQVPATKAPSALGDLDLQNLKQAVDRQLRISKAFQGILIAGIIRTAQVHAKITWSDTTEEARPTHRRGVVRTPTRWAFHPAHAHIKAVIVPLPL